MKRLFLVLGLLVACGMTAEAASKKHTTTRHFESYADTGNELSVEVTLSSANVVSTVTVPSNAKGFRIYSRSNNSRFAVQLGDTERSAEAVGSVDGSVAPADLDVAEVDLGVGGIAKADAWETRLLPANGNDRTIYLRSTTANVVIDLEFF